MTMMVRIYESQESANDAARALSQKGFIDESIAVISPSAEVDPARAVRHAIDEGYLPGSYVGVATRSLAQGRSIVTVDAPFGRGQLAAATMGALGPVATSELPAYAPDNPSPFSDLLGIPTLTEGRAESGDMAHWSSFHAFGEPRISRNAAPLSSRLGMKLLTTPKRDWRSSFGLPLLSKNPAPLSSMLRWRTLSASKGPWKTSFGLPLLSRNPTPISSLFSLPVLTRKKQKKGSRYRRS